MGSFVFLIFHSVLTAMQTQSHTWISVGIVVSKSIDVKTETDNGRLVLGEMNTRCNFFDQVRIFAAGNLDPRLVAQKLVVKLHA